MARNWDTSVKSKIVKISTSLVLSCLTSQVFASGFALLEQNVTNLGLAYSGTAALAEDASTGYYNPAGLTRLGESELVLSGIIIQGDFDFTATSSNVSLIPGRAVPGDNTDDPGTVNFVPTFHLSKRIDDRWVFGFNVTTPFGLNTEYEQDGIARYLATNSSIQTLNFSPNIAYELFPCISLGAGVDAAWGKANLETRIGDGTAALDGFNKEKIHGWGYGWHAGLMWSPWTSTRLGINYRSHINFYGEGNTESLVPYSPLFGDAAGTYTIRKVFANITLPETATFSFYHAINPQFAITGDFAWTNWSRFHTLRLRHQPGGVVPLIVGGTTPGLDTDTHENFRDTRRYALGLIYTHDLNWLFRFGLAFDETPTRDEYRTARLPDEDRIWVALGGAYTVDEAVRIDFGYAHLFFNNATINEFAPFIAPAQGAPLPGISFSNPRITSAALAGEYDGDANIFGVQLRYSFA